MRTTASTLLVSTLTCFSVFAGPDKEVREAASAIFESARPLALTPPPCIPVPPGAVGWWRMENNGEDSIGVNDGTLGDWPGDFVTGVVGQGLLLNGHSGYVVESPDMDVGGSVGFTLEGWVKGAGQGASLSSPEDLFGWAGKGAWFSASGSRSDRLIMARLKEPNAFRTVTLMALAGTVTNKSWYHVALTFEAGQGRAVLFVNGMQSAQTNLGPFRPNTKSTFYVRAPAVTQSARMFQVVDEVTVYNRPLLPAEIQAIYQAGEGGKCAEPFACAPVPEGIVAWWRCETNLLDCVGLNNGVPHGSVSYSAGRVGKGLKLDTAWFHVPARPELDVGQGPGLTIELWSKGIYYGEGRWIQFSGEGTGEKVTFACGPQILSANLVDSEGKSHVVTGNLMEVPNRVWQHLAVTYDKNSGWATLYLSGLPLGMTNLGTFTPRTAGSLYFIPFEDLNNRSGPWELDEVALYARALRPEEIRRVALGRGLGKCPEAPTITSHPSSKTALIGSDAFFEVGATGTPNLRYQWFRGGQPLLGATQSILTLQQVGASKAGVYRAAVSNHFGWAVSSNAVLSVIRANSPPVPMIRVGQEEVFRTWPRLIFIAADGTSTVRLDGTQSSDPEGDPFQLTWLDGPVVLAVAPVVSAELGVGLHVIALRADDGWPSGVASASIEVEVVTPGHAVGLLIDLLEASRLPRTSVRPLVTTLRQAQVSVDAGRLASGANQLRAFQHKIEAQGPRIMSDTAAEVLATA